MYRFFFNTLIFLRCLPVVSLLSSRGDDHASVRVLVPLTGIYRYVTGCDFLPIKQPKEVKLLSFNLAEQMPFMSNVRRINVDISRRLNDSPGLYGDSFGRKGAAQVAGHRDGGRWTDGRIISRIVDSRRDVLAIISVFSPLAATGGHHLVAFNPAIFRYLPPPPPAPSSLREGPQPRRIY